MDNKERIQEIERQIALLKAEKEQLKGGTGSFEDLKDYFGEKLGIEARYKSGTRCLHFKQNEAWEHIRKLAICSVCGSEKKYLKDLTMDEWRKSREMVKKLIDFYVENCD